jgi:GGDEF domain-containing protein
VLRRTADVLRAAVAGAPGVLTARLGGDEFCVLMPGATPADELARAVTALVAHHHDPSGERHRLIVAAHPIPKEES